MLPKDQRIKMQTTQTFTQKAALILHHETFCNLSITHTPYNNPSMERLAEHLKANGRLKTECRCPAGHNANEYSCKPCLSGFRSVSYTCIPLLPGQVCPTGKFLQHRKELFHSTAKSGMYCVDCKKCSGDQYVLQCGELQTHHHTAKTNARAINTIQMQHGFRVATAPWLRPNSNNWGNPRNVQPTLQACQSQCLSIPGCKYGTYIESQERLGECWLSKHASQMMSCGVPCQSFAVGFRPVTPHPTKAPTIGSVAPSISPTIAPTYESNGFEEQLKYTYRKTAGHCATCREGHFAVIFLIDRRWRRSSLFLILMGKGTRCGQVSSCYSKKAEVHAMPSRNVSDYRHK